MLQQTQRDHDEAAHDRLAAIRAIMKCEPGEEAACVEHLVTQYRLCREQIDRIEREAAEEEHQQIEKTLGLMEGLRAALGPIRSKR